MNPPPILRPERFLPHAELLLAMSTRVGGVSPEPYGMNLSFRVGDAHENVVLNRQRFFDALKISERDVAIPGQVHSATVRFAGRPGIFEDCDALVSDRRRVFLSVSVADCVPLFLFDTKRRVVAIAHAGWRGAAAGIAAHTVEFMRQHLGSDPKDVIAYIGPSARSCCYEVGDEVGRRFDQHFLRHERGKVYLDLLGCNVSQLVGAGVLPTAIESSPHCTICTPQLFHSYRRDGQKSGRMVGIIGLL